MANFKTHLNGAFAVSGILGLVSYKAGLINGHQFLVCVAIGTIGGLLPDIDSDHSTPIRLGFDAASLIVAFALVIHWRTHLSLLSLLVLWLAAYGVMRYGMFTLFTKMTVHRGIIHSIPYMAALALGLVCVNAYLFDTPVMLSWLYGLFLFIGAMVHLGLDEAYSVDLLNRRLKRSSGTAMKLYQHKQRFYYIALYMIIAAAIFIAPPFIPFWEKLTDPATWELLKGGVFPSKFTADMLNSSASILDK
ncbi:metal-dependent hydrolase [Psychrobacter sp. I-STPA10]|uniref:metal-dependent hydrolase n=1 Tax=Psychrobacter sp. I-STPA10 TaxID=2585769 RepID=UPI001E43D9D3|nr:metal-dependent hydrolase [Psychrobacter sp. I-STPA10]